MFENNLKTAAIYARVSTTRQAEEGFSLPSQIDACVRKAKELGISNIIKYVDNASGTTLDRPALTIMRKAIREKKIDIIICYDQDRLSRNLGQQLVLTEEIEKYCQKLIFICGDYHNSPNGRLFYAIKGAIAEYEREKIIERCIRGKKEKYKKGKTSNSHLFGYQYNPITELYEINTDEAVIVRRIFKLYINGMSSRQILRQFQIENIPKYFQGKNVGWNDPSAIMRILKNDSYTGVFHAWKHNSHNSLKKAPKQRYKDTSEWINVPIPAIISEEEFILANQIIKENTDRSTRNEKRIHLLSKIAYCTCGRKIYVRPNNNKDYYYCSSKSYKKRNEIDIPFCPIAKYMPADKIDNIFWGTLTKICISEDTLQKYINRQQEDSNINEIQQQLLDLKTLLQKKQTEQVSILEWYSNQLIDEDVAKLKLLKLKNIITELKSQQQILSNKLNNKNKPQKIYDIFKQERKITLEEKRNLIRKIVDRVYLKRTDPAISSNKYDIEVDLFIIFK